MSTRTLLIPCLVLLSGCVFDRSGLAPSDRSNDTAVDSHTAGEATGTVDAVADLQTADGPVRDAPASDGPVRDAPASDAEPLPDTTLGPDTKPPPSCDDLFKSSTPGYTLCSETPTSCRFYFDVSNGSDCNTLCGALGCLKAEDNEPGTKCELETNMACGGQPCTCSSSIGTGICTCNR